MKKSLLSLLAIFCALSAMAALRMPAYYGNHMVMQRDVPVVLRGVADPGKRVTAVIGGRKATAKAGKDGRWQMSLPAFAAGGPYTLQVTAGKEKLCFEDILFGEVWICSGQSNMEFRVRSAADAGKEIACADYPLIRSFNVAQAMNNKPQEDLVGAWQVCSPATVADFSAVGYFFARDLYHRLDVPVGFINTSWGGTDIESWMSMEALDSFPQYAKQLQRMRTPNFETYIAHTIAKRQEFQRALAEELGEPQRWYDPATDRSGWGTYHVPGFWNDGQLSEIDGVVWFSYRFTLPEECRGKAAILNLACIDDNDKTWINGKLVGETAGYDVKRVYPVPEGLLEAENEIVVKITDMQAGGGIYGTDAAVYLAVDNKQIPLAGEWRYKIAISNEAYGYVDYGPNTFPSQLFNAMLHPLIGFPMKGVIWYQGENNASRALEYYDLFPALINDWRSRWDSDFPFYWVQLANYMQPDTLPSESAWAELRNAQAATLALPHTGQAVIIDIGEANDIHPRNKQDVGRRLARWALRNDYGFDTLQASGPVCIAVERQGGDLVLTFDEVAGGLTVRDKYGYLCAFAVAGSDDVYRWVQARIDGENRVVLSCGGIDNPRKVRYAWGDNPDDANLYNSAGLPASPFEIALP